MLRKLFASAPDAYPFCVHTQCPKAGSQATSL